MRRRIASVKIFLSPRHLDASANTYHLRGVADLLSKIGDLLYWEAKRDPDLWKKTSGEPNTAALARRMETSQATVWRLLNGQRSLRRTSRSKTPLDEYMPEAAVLAGIGRLIRQDDLELILSAIMNAPPRPPEVRRRAKRKKSHK